ncbi:MFS multidrug transporter-like protein [Talaromyces proteolyticus]|uniref:MFS multidrug transporter-like protein n=1 Tax=Talaromyces proteolyticus TaxID=1131652 RepID=A0AAD4L0H6_9EURO|nr:MFS multidrug transporter-like protein [Talaromyces proteolyticus]KAH8701610.1 MFS multidrug transporter-like protein [Talaromyces proteolyticus]
MTSNESRESAPGPLFRDAARLNENESKGPTTLETFKDQQANILPHKKLMVVFPAIALAQMISYLDQTSVSTAVPTIGGALNMGSSISWVPTCFLVASTSIQLINGRLSDIVGRKPLLLTCMGVLAVADLCAGFSTTPGMLFAFRTIAGLGGGAITALVMIVASDITTLEQRGKYNGFIGAMVGLGNGIGPLIGGAFTQKASWRWCFWFISPVIVAVMILIAIVIPPSNVRGKAGTKVRMIDWLGLLINIAAVVLILIPISEGGSIYSWNSPLVIAMLIIGGLLIPAFVFVEWKVAKLPLMPIRLFQSDMSANLVFIQGTLHGVVYWANLYYVPLYLQNVRGYDPIMSGVLILPMVASHGLGSLFSGQIISRTGHYNPTIISSNFVWMIGASLQTVYTRTTPVWAICLIGFLQGIGIGGAFQPGLVALLAHSRKADRAVANSLRNFLRIMGGSVGLTISGAILNNVLQNKLSSFLSADSISQISSSTYGLQSLNLSAQQTGKVLDAYMSGMHVIFIMYAPIIGVCFLCAVLIKDNGVAEKDANQQSPPSKPEQSVGKVEKDGTD